MSDTSMIQRAFAFLQKCAQERTPFTAADLAAASGWTASNTATNLSKRLREFVRREGKQYHAVPDILAVGYDEFEGLFQQKRRLFADYALRVTPSVLVYEFFMPLTHEVKLRRALDHLFYREAVEQRILMIGLDQVRSDLKLPDSCADTEVVRMVTELVEGAITGYSVYLVNGRFRMAPLASRQEAAKRSPTDVPYLMDETTAVVRFLLPVEAEADECAQTSLFEPPHARPDLAERAEQLHWVFLRLFAEPFVRVVREEEEIWLLESGMKSAVYRWVRTDA